MKTCLVTGAKGFIGSAIVAEAERMGVEVIAVDLDNYEQVRGAKADILINAAGNSRKFIDEQDPTRGFELSVASVMRIMLDFKFGLFVHLSSGAIYSNEGNPALNTEVTELMPLQMTRYGFHKWLAEQIVRHYAPKHLIIRMGGFVGPGLKKNAVFDILTGGQLFVHPDSEFQYMDTRDLARLVFELAGGAAGNETMFNLSATGTVSVRRIAEWAGYKLGRDPLGCPTVRAELNVEKAGRVVSLPETGETVRKFIEEVQSGKVKLK
ncbi:MAG: NAD-dependent epimerase/dehydratase family protein [Kiritimatiellia bacterium]